MRSLLPNRLIALLLCIALMVRVVVPAGFMPDMQALQHGIYKIRICTGYGTQNMNMVVDEGQNQTDSGKSGSDHQSEKSGHSICPFAGMLGSALPILALTLTLLMFWRQLRFSHASAYGFSTSLTSALPRGPPALI